MVKRKYLKTKEIAEMLGIETMTVVDWIKTGKLKGVKFGKFWYIPVSEVEKYFGTIPDEG